MRKKKVEELKAKLKQEILKEIKEEEDKKKKVEIVKPVKPPVLHHSKEELYEIRKSFLIIFLLAITILFLSIIFIFINPFESSSNKKDEPQEEVMDEIEEDEEISLLSIKDGKIENSNEEMHNLLFKMIPNAEEYYVYDSTYLYSMDKMLVDDISDSYLLYLMTKDSEFINIINDIGKTKVEICNKEEPIRIPIDNINNVLEKLYNRTLNEYSDFTYTHYVDGFYSTYIKFVYSDGYYIGSCFDEELVITYNSVALPSLKEAFKENNEIKITVEVAFMTQNDIYADYNLTKIISNNINTDIIEYINEADEYTYIFKIDNKRFVFDRIEKINKY